MILPFPPFFLLTSVANVSVDGTPGGILDVILLALSSGDQGLLLTDGLSFLKLASSL